MFGIATSSLKMYGIIAIGAIVAIFLFIFKMRGVKIDGLEKTIDEMVQRAKANQQEAIETRKARKKSKEFQGIANDGSSNKSNAGKEISDLVDSTLNTSIETTTKEVDPEKVKKIKQNEAFLDAIRVGL